jgi:hypothetical protein
MEPQAHSLHKAIGRFEADFCRSVANFRIDPRQ